MNEETIRKIAREEAQKAMMQNYTSGDSKVPPHTHNGTDGLQISQSDIIPLITANGTLDMSSVTTYKLKLGKYGITPRTVTFYGGAKHSSVTKQHAMIIGNAQLGVNQQFQPQSSTSVIIVPVVTKIIQGSSFMYMNNTDLTKNVVGNSQGHIVYLFDDTGTDLIVANVSSFNKSEIDITVSTLATGWTISGLWIVT